VSDPETSDDQRLVATLEREVRAVLRALHGSVVEEFRLERGGTRIRLRRACPPTADTPIAAPARHADSVAAAPAVEPLAATGAEVRATMVGAFHHAREPQGVLLAADGDYVEAGRPVGVIETLGMASDVEAPAPGWLWGLLADGHPVEYGQVIARILPEPPVPLTSPETQEPAAPPAAAEPPALLEPPEPPAPAPS
jgi:pyruvate dehydrogenase E2 component (dihydrolipoamide acetyltransferase)